MTTRVKLSATGFDVFPLCLGGNVFGWSANKDESFAVLDAFYDAGGNFIDTADVYSEWVAGNQGGESETIIGEWMASRGNRKDMVIATKVAKYSKQPGLSPSNIKSALDGSLRRLKIDYVDLYYAHEDDEKVPQSDVMGAFDSLAQEGKIRRVGASNFTGARLRSAHEASEQNGIIKFTALQNHYNMIERAEFESGAGKVARELGVDSIPFFALARGFLTGKYQPGATVDSVRAGGVTEYFTDKGWAIVSTIGELAQELSISPSAISLAWLRAKGQTPIASARTVEQLKEIMQLVTLSSEAVARLDAVSA